ncbi:MAG: fibrobacter succinogenes major paralogous domain-containing protein [Chitinispirillales bacterium]|jgi:uncharacterized protein (TIGR02145 family)|nr:fibrobacter succinogenes major paralogous domain-containing protein [Chitinispirillales bacterium]
MNFFTRYCVRALLSAAVFGAIGLFGCGRDNPSELVGHWVHISGATEGKPLDIELFKNGTGSFNGGAVMWMANNGRFIMRSTDFDFGCGFSAADARLTLDYDDSTSANFVDRNRFKIKSGASSFVDNRDGKKYKNIKISEQVWMAENLNYETPSGSCCYGNDNSNCAQYGRLYDWNTAPSVCPAGWRLPTREEWDILVKLVNITANGNAGDKLKSTGGWNNSENGTDDYGFSALPGGARYGDAFYHIGQGCFWWDGDGRVYGNSAFYGRLDPPGDGHSVRCIQGDVAPPASTEPPATEEPSTTEPPPAV